MRGKLFDLSNFMTDKSLPTSAEKHLFIQERCCADGGSKLFCSPPPSIRNTFRQQIWVRSSVCTITLLMGETMRVVRTENKRIPDNCEDLSRLLENTPGVLKQSRESAERKTREHLQHQFSV